MRKMGSIAGRNAMMLGSILPEKLKISMKRLPSSRASSVWLPSFATTRTIRKI